MPSTSHSTLTAAMGVAPVLGAEVGPSASRPDTRRRLGEGSSDARASGAPTPEVTAQLYRQ